MKRIISIILIGLVFVLFVAGIAITMTYEHQSQRQSIGAQTVYVVDKEIIYNMPAETEMYVIRCKNSKVNYIKMTVIKEYYDDLKIGDSIVMVP